MPTQDPGPEEPNKDRRQKGGGGVELDAWIEGLSAAELGVAVLGAISVFGYLLLLARAYERARLLIALAEGCRRRVREEEEIEKARGVAPRLDHYRRLSRALEDRLRAEGVRRTLTRS